MPGMSNAGNHPPMSLGLGGDGDEINAIEDVERQFGVNLDLKDANQWTTVGHVFHALQQALPDHEAGSKETWGNFCQAITRQTGVDPTQVTADTLLLGGRRLDWRLLVCGFCAVGLTIALSHLWQ